MTIPGSRNAYESGYAAGLAAGRVEAAADTRDAERYRFVRGNAGWLSYKWLTHGSGDWIVRPAEHLDAAIDAALAVK